VVIPPKREDMIPEEFYLAPPPPPPGARVHGIDAGTAMPPVDIYYAEATTRAYPYAPPQDPLADLEVAPHTTLDWLIVIF